LTPITSKPTNTALQLLQHQLFTNARSVPSARGGGLHGHLAILLSNADYIARVGVAFSHSFSSCPPPVAVGTAAAISIALRAYKDTLNDAALYNNLLRAALTAQILTVVNPLFLSALEDPYFGFVDVTPFAMLLHLRDEYGTMTPEE
jgi:hypothetical protein